MPQPSRARPAAQQRASARQASPTSDEDPTQPLLGDDAVADPPVQHARQPRNAPALSSWPRGGRPASATENAPAAATASSRPIGRQRLLLATCVALAIGLFTTLAVLFFHGGPSESNICFEHSCISVADSMMSNGNPNVDACDDFYQHACGNYEDSMLIPDDKSRVGTFDELARKNREIVINQLERELESPEVHSKSTPQLDAVKATVRKYYSSCMNVERINSYKAKPLIFALRSIFANHTNFVDQLEECALTTLPKLSMFGGNSVLSVDVTSDLLAPTKQIIAVSPGGLMLPNKMSYTDQNLLNEYRDLIIRVLSVVPIEVDQVSKKDSAKKPTVSEIADMIVKFEADIATIWPDPVDQNDPLKTFNKMKLDDAEDKFSSFSLKKYITETMLQAGIELKSEIMTYVSLTWPSYVPALNQILKNPKNRDALSYHSRWVAIYSWIDQASTEYSELFKNFKKTFYGVKAPPPRSEFCLRKTEQALGFGVSYLFVEKTFSEEARSKVIEMTKAILGEFKKKLENVNWISAKVRDYAKKKIDMMTLKIGYPDFVRNGTYLLEYYNGVTSDADRFFENSLSAFQVARRRDLSQILSPTNFGKWDMFPHVVNAYHEPSKNEIVFPAGILQPPFFHARLPDAVNYGALGVVIGHELSHAFDNHGRKFGFDGSLFDWWDEPTAKTYKARAQRFEAQYSRFSLMGPDNTPIFVNGTLTLGENLGDNSGIMQSMAAFIASAEKSKSGLFSGSKKDEAKVRTSKIPGFDRFSPKQMFFLSFANVWCNRMRPRYAQNLLQKDPHAPGNVRVLGTLQNSQEFSEAFKCPSGAKMNPAEKNILW